MFIFSANNSPLARFTTLARDLSAEAAIYEGPCRLVRENADVRLTVTGLPGRARNELTQLAGKTVVGVIVAASPTALRPASGARAMEHAEPGVMESMEQNAVSETAVDDAELLNKLTAAEQNVLRMLSEGLSTKQMAEQLFVSPRTIDTHRAQISSKLGVRSIALLTRFAIRVGLSPL